MELQGTASRSGCVPGEPFARVLQEWCDRHDSEALAAMTVLSEVIDIDISQLRKIKDGKREWISFDLADKIITRVDELSWGMNEELTAIYKGFNFEWLDRVHPCVRAA